MIILGLDLSSKSSGYSVFDNNKLIDYGCITSASSNLYKRIDVMVQGIKEVLNKYSINHVYIEDVLPDDVKHNQTVYKALTYLQGYILHLLDDYHLSYTFFTASQWRAKCGIHTGRGIKRESLKSKDIEFVKNQYNIDVNDDIADAICIASAGLNIIPIKPEINKTEDGFEFG